MLFIEQTKRIYIDYPTTVHLKSLQYFGVTAFEENQQV